MKKLTHFLWLIIFLISANAYAQKNILILGDSLTEGIGIDKEEAYPHIVEGILKKQNQNVVVINGGVSGSTSASGLQRLKWHMKKPIDVLVLELGANDGLRGLDLKATEDNLKLIIDLAQKNKIKVMCLGLLMPPNYGKEYTRNFEKMYQRIAKEKKIPLLPFFIEQVAGKKEYNLADGIHPNAKGHQLIANSIAKFIAENL